MDLRITDGFRQSMTWLHTWAGIGVSAVLFAIFWTGSLTVFDKEIDKWMKPELRMATPETVRLDDIFLPQLSDLNPAPGSAVWIGRPKERNPAIQVFYDDADGASHRLLLDPRDGTPLDLTDSHAGTEFFFHFHFMLHIPGILGYWIVAFAAMAMMVLVVSGVFIHRKIFQDFFTFRPRKKIRRSALDFHNLTALIALPFHFLLPLSGVFILISVYFPWSIALPFGGDQEQFRAATLAYELPKIEAAGAHGNQVKAVDAFVERAEEIWTAEDDGDPSKADWIAIFNVNDANAYIVVERYFASRRIALGPYQVVFDPKTGDIIDQFKPLPVHHATNWLEGLHWIQFDHWPLRWLYFFGGLSGCGMIASGLVFWMQSRIKKAHQDPLSVRVVRAISVGSITGIIAASSAFLIANRLIPKEIALGDIHRHDLEIWVFFFVWIATYIHAAVRNKAAWRDQSVAIALMAVTAVVLNWVTTGDHPMAAANASLWSIAMMDVVLILSAAMAGWTAIQLKKSETAQAPARSQTGVLSAIEKPAE